METKEHINELYKAIARQENRISNLVTQVQALQGVLNDQAPKQEFQPKYKSLTWRICNVIKDSPIPMTGEEIKGAIERTLGTPVSIGYIRCSLCHHYKRKKLFRKVSYDLWELL